MRHSALLVAAGLVALTWSVSHAHGSEICIKCTSPAKTYRCALLGEDAPVQLRHRGFYCASRIADEEDHQTCAAVRRETQCAGERRDYVYDPTAPVPGPLVEDEDGEALEQPPQPKDGPPGTVAELTQETARQTEEGLKKAADQTVETTRGVGEQVSDAVRGAAGAVDRAARATFRCLGSWFDEC